jgi:hypothetical protein
MGIAAHRQRLLAPGMTQGPSHTAGARSCTVLGLHQQQHTLYACACCRACAVTFVALGNGAPDLSANIAAISAGEVVLSAGAFTGAAMFVQVRRA